MAIQLITEEIRICRETRIIDLEIASRYWYTVRIQQYIDGKDCWHPPTIEVCPEMVDMPIYITRLLTSHLAVALVIAAEYDKDTGKKRQPLKEVVKKENKKLRTGSNERKTKRTNKSSGMD